MPWELKCKWEYIPTHEERRWAQMRFVQGGRWKPKENTKSDGGGTVLLAVIGREAFRVHKRKIVVSKDKKTGKCA